MKLALAILVVLGSFHTLKGQYDTPSYSDSLGLVFIGLPNPIKIDIDGWECSILNVTLSNGVLKQSHQACAYAIYPDSAEICTMVVSGIRDGETTILKTIDFEIREVPAPVPCIGNSCGGKHVVSKDSLLSCAGVRPAFQNFPVDMSAVVSSFNVNITHGDGSSSAYLVRKRYFTSELKNALKELNSGDVVRFQNIVAQIPPMFKWEIEDIEFTIE